MPLLPRLTSLWRNLFRKARKEQELTEELDAYLEMLVEQKINEGLDPVEARRAALIELGGRQQVKEKVWDVSAGHQFETMWQDLRYALRILRAKPGFTFAIVLLLALGIGANTTVFTWINALFFNPLPGVNSAGQLVTLHSVLERSGGEPGSVSYPDYVDFRDRNEVCAGLAAYSMLTVGLSNDEGRPERLYGEVVSGNYFDVLGVRAVAGRTFAPEEDRTQGTHPVAVISYRLWQRRFGADPNLIGKSIRLDGRNFTVIGVAPRGFAGGTVGLMFDIWIPLAMQKGMRSPRDLHADRGSYWLAVVGRLKPGIGLAEAQANMQAIARGLEQALPDTNAGVSVRLFRFAMDPTSGGSSLLPVVVMLMAVAGLMLAIVCANIAGLLLVRASARRKEIGVRLALGASRGRVVRQLLTESLLPACLGGGAGLLLSQWLAPAFTALIPPIEAPIGFDFSPDARVLAFTLAATLITALICGLAPALQASKVDVVMSLKDETGTLAGGSRRLRLRSVLVVAQLALSFVLLVSAGLFIRSLQQTQMVNLGFNPESVWQASFDPSKNGYDERRGREFYRQLRERVAAIPGVESVSLANSIPPYLFGHNSTSVEIEGYTPRRDESVLIDYDSVGPAYFETMQIPLIAGRGFTEADDERAAPVAVVSELMARRYWQGRNPIGSRLRAGGAWHEVIGVARDVKQFGPTAQTPPFMYFSLQQSYYSAATLLVRTRGEPGEWREAVRREAHALDKAIPAFGERTLEAASGIALFDHRLAVSFLSGFGLLALLLSAIGLYGVMAYAVAARTREIGIRIALGAQNSDVMKMVLGQGARLTAIGVLLGLAAAFAVTRLLEGFLFGVSVRDVMTFAGVAALLSIVALLACYVPARRAMKTDPTVALRSE